MNENITKRNALLAQKVIKGLTSRNMTGYYAATKEEAKEIALSLIPEGSSVTMGGADKRTALRPLDPLREDRILHGLQVAGYDLLPVPDYALLQACGQDPCDSGQ